jgi:hypothetical protein
MSEKYSIERATGFKVIIEKLEKELTSLRRTDSVKVKQGLVREKQEELALYKGMYITEMDIYTGLIEREPKKFLLSDDGFTYIKNPKWFPQKEVG